MSTKLRILVKKRGFKPLHGTRAIVFLTKLIRSKLMNTIWPPDWDDYTTQKKLEFFAQYLPADTRMLLIRERKWTRKNRSLYVKMIRDAARLNRIPDDEDRDFDAVLEDEARPRARVGRLEGNPQWRYEGPADQAPAAQGGIGLGNIAFNVQAPPLRADIFENPFMPRR